MYNWDWSWISVYKEQLLGATFVTFKLNVYIILAGSAIGLLLGLAKRTNFYPIRLITIVIIDVLRTLPALVLLMWVYFCVPIFLNINIDAYTTAVIVLSLNLAAFIAEIVDAGIESVPKIHIDYGVLLGLSSKQNLRYVILPIAIRSMIPPIVGQYINSIKLSVLASFIAVPELLSVTQDIISQTYRPLEFYTVLAVLFLIILLPGTIWSKKFELKAMIKNSNKNN
jgi:polar amino acid transport system permease protein